MGKVTHLLRCPECSQLVATGVGHEFVEVHLHKDATSWHKNVRERGIATITTFRTAQVRHRVNGKKVLHTILA